MKIRNYSYEEYQRIANRFLKENGIDENSNFPFEIDVLAEKAGYEIKPIPLLKKDFGVKGCIAKIRGGSFKIIIDSDHYMEEEFYFPFTIAEEIGHILLHDHIYDNVENIKDAIDFHFSVSNRDYRIMEQQARNVGSFILLPSFLLNRFLLNYCKKNEKEIRKISFYDIYDLSDFIASNISHQLCISKKVIELTLSTRYPGFPIYTVVNYFGDSIFK